MILPRMHAPLAVRSRFSQVVQTADYIGQMENTVAFLWVPMTLRVPSRASAPKWENIF